MKKNNSKNFRDEIADAFVKALDEDPITFIKGWDFSTTGTPINGFTDRQYNGLNKLQLKMKEIQNNYSDNRWLTFKQIQNKGYQLEKGAKGEKIEYWLPWDKKEKKWISWKDYQEKIKNPEENIENYILRQKLYTVFNGSQIKGISPIDINLKLNDIKENELIERLSDALNVPIEEKFNSSMAYYSPSEDKIVLPSKEQFKSDSAYARTALHELGHSTGHESRLNRTFGGIFGSEKYAYEELVAEITSAFMGEYLKEPLTTEILDQHKAYIQSWSKSIKEDKNFLFGAIKDADKASEYMVEKARLNDITHEKQMEGEEEFSFFSKDKTEYEF